MINWHLNQLSSFYSFNFAKRNLKHTTANSAKRSQCWLAENVFHSSCWLQSKLPYQQSFSHLILDSPYEYDVDCRYRDVELTHDIETQIVNINRNLSETNRDIDVESLVRNSTPGQQRPSTVDCLDTARVRSSWDTFLLGHAVDSCKPLHLFCRGTIMRIQKWVRIKKKICCL